ncbi:hypothetical protein KSS87_017892 [Heliosperma pusillum]|nr:hypothetical protein KSS87_017892 [Heliosperma pusillum]
MDISSKRGNEQTIKKSIEKPPYVVAEDDTKPVLRDPVSKFTSLCYCYCYALTGI